MFSAKMSRFIALSKPFRPLVKQYNHGHKNTIQVSQRVLSSQIHTAKPSLQDEKVTINFINRKGELTTVKALPDDTLLDVAVDNDLEIESFGVCEGTLGCSTCHVILEEKVYQLLDKTCTPTAEELDMLDLACGLTETSRLGCQVEVTKDLEGITVRVPKEAIDAREL